MLMQASFQNSCSPLSQPQRRSSLIFTDRALITFALPRYQPLPATGIPSLLILCKAELQILAQMGKRVASISRNEQFVCRAVIKFALWWLNLPSNARIYISWPQPVVRWDRGSKYFIHSGLSNFPFRLLSPTQMIRQIHFVVLDLFGKLFSFYLFNSGSGEIKS